MNHYVEHHIWKNAKGDPYLAVYKGKKARAFIDAVAIFAQGQTAIPEDEAELKRGVDYTVTVNVWLGPRQRLDADNAGKVALDALQYARVIHSDAFVSTCTVHIHKADRINPRTHFIVERK